MKKILGSSVMVGVLVGMTLMCNNVDDKSLGFDNKNIKLANNENKESVVEVENNDKKLYASTYAKTSKNVLEINENIDNGTDSKLHINGVSKYDVMPIAIDVVVNTTEGADLTGMIITDRKEISNITERNEEVIYADAIMYDYYSDSQVGKGSTPLAITDARYSGFHGHFNRSLKKYMEFGKPKKTPTRYPMYLGNFLKASKGESYEGILYDTDEGCKESNFYRGCNSGVYSTVATPGLIDNRLTYVGGESYITMSNPDNGRWAYVPYFDKNFLLNNKIKSDSKLSMGNVIENLKFPFRRQEEDGVEYYTFDSRVDVVRFNNKMKLEYRGTDSSEIVYDNAGGPSFLPFDTPGTDLTNLNLCFGMKIEIPFYMTKSGTINGKDIVFEFSGDDDVWIFVDDELILDIGGCHRRVGGRINFRTKEGMVDGWVNTKVAYSKRLIYIDAALTHWTDYAAGIINEPLAYYDVKTEFSSSLKNSFRDNRKEHVLTVFYMERAKGASNLHMKFNLPMEQIHEEVKGKYVLFPLH